MFDIAKIFVLLSLFINVVLFSYMIYTKRNLFKSAEDETELTLAPELKPDVHTVSKHGLPFEIPVPKDKVSGVLFDHESGTYCLFALSFPELHLILKPPADYSQEKLETLAILFTRCFKQKLQVRVFINNNSNVVESIFH